PAPPRAAAPDGAFPQAIAPAAHTPWMAGLPVFVGPQVLAARRVAWETAARYRGGPGAAEQEHAALAEAIAVGDAGAARQAARRHLEAAAARMGLELD
ncbi:FCD domain-containing protein, partial [Cupriavidus gilardii]